MSEKLISSRQPTYLKDQAVGIGHSTWYQKKVQVSQPPIYKQCARVKIFEEKMNEKGMSKFISSLTTTHLW